MKKTSKILSLFLALIMAISIIPMSTITASATTSGFCGENVTWEFDESTGTLTISGTGEMYSYFSESEGTIIERPWESYMYDIKNVVINDGVTTIGDSAFTGCESLENAIIGNSVTVIGMEAFFFCQNLTNVTIGDSVTTFGGCAFFGCASLRSITLPSSVTEIDSFTFQLSGLRSITVDSNNKYYSNDECGVLFNKDKTELILYPSANTRTSYTIPDSVTIIGDWSFYNCYSLTSVTIPDSVTTIEDSAFFDCYRLTDVYYSGTEEEWNSISIDNSYNNNDPLLNATIHFDKASNPSGTCGENVTWEYDESTGTLTISGTGEMNSYLSESEDEILERPWENYIYDIDNVIIDNSVTSIGECAFYGHSSLNYIEIKKGVKTIGMGSFAECSALTNVKIPDSVTTIGSLAFAMCNNIKNITIPDSVTSLGEAAFYECKGLISVTIGNGVTTIDEASFAFCESLTSVTIPDSVTTIGVNAFEHCNGLTSVTIGSGVTSIGEYAFYFCEGLESIIIPGSVSSIGEAAFYGCSNLSGIIVDIESLYYSNDDCGVLFNKDKTVLVSYPAGNQRKIYSLPEGVTQIDSRAFSSNNYIEEVILPESLIKIDHRAFENCIRLSKINLPNSLEYIGDSAFWDCRGIADVTIPERVSYIGNGAFGYNRSLQYIKVDSDNPYYSSDDFGVLFNKDKTILLCYPMGNTRTEYAIPLCVKAIAIEAFWCNATLKSIIMGDSIEVIESGAFTGFEYLTDVYYYGTEEEWNNISIDNTDNSNAPLLNATIHFNYVDPNKFTGIDGDYFYKDGIKQKAYQLVEFEGDFYFINDYHKIAKNKRIYLSQKFVDGFTYEDGTPLAVGYYEFDENGKMIVNNGVIGDYFYKNGVKQKAYQLVEFEGNYYFINDYNKVAKNKRIYLSQKFVEGTDLKVGYYDFDADGKLVLKNGPDGDYFYINGIRQNAYQLVEFEGNFYFINDSHKLAKNKRIYLSQRFVDGFTLEDGTPLAVGYYDFDEDGKLILLNGPVGDYFYINGVKQKAYQLVEFEGNYYFINDSHKIAKNKRLYMSQRFVEGTDLKVGYYEFDADGKMIIE